MKTSLFLFVPLCGGFLSVRGFAEEPIEVSTMSLVQVLDMAREKNPDILAAQQSWKVAEAKVSPAKTWPNPSLAYVDERFPGTNGAPPEKIKHYRVEQSVPFPGKLSGDAQMQHHESLIAEANYRSKIIDVLGEVRMRYYQLYLTDQKIELAGQSVQALKSVLGAAQSRLASGQSSTSDVFMAQLELRKMENALFEERQARTLTEIELNTLMNQPTDTAWGPASAPELAELPGTLAELQTLARDNAPEYMAAAHEINHARAMQSRNRLEFAPDFDLMYEREVSPRRSGGPANRNWDFASLYGFNDHGDFISNRRNTSSRRNRSRKRCRTW